MSSLLQIAGGRRRNLRGISILLRRNATRHAGAAARAIIRNPDTFDGPAAGLVLWAFEVLGRPRQDSNFPRRLLYVPTEVATTSVEVSLR